MRLRASQLTLFGLVVFFLWMPPTVSVGEGIPALPEDMSLMQLNTEYKKIRKVRGHFNGGVWNNEVDQWLGHKHQLMLQFSKYFGRGGHQVSEVIRYMGSPDNIIEPGSPMPQQFNRLPQYTGVDLNDSRFLIYQWRGDHDFLFFEIKNEVVIASSWWHAGE